MRVRTFGLFAYMIQVLILGAILTVIAFTRQDVVINRGYLMSEGLSTEEEWQGTTTYHPWRSLEERTRFVKVALSFQGTPYDSGGITCEGADCSGFVYTVYRLFGTKLPRTVIGLYGTGKKVQRDELEDGDLVFFDGADRPIHVGIYVGQGMFVHASTAAKMIRTDFLHTPGHLNHFIGAVRIRELMKHK
jgi:hypothetical protein